MRPIARYGIGVLVASGLGAASLFGLSRFLGEELGPETMPTASVTGRVHVHDRPVGGGWVELIPADGTVGNLRSAPLRPDGTFRATRVAVGRVAIRLVNAPANVGFWGRFRSFASPIRCTISGSAPTALDIDLREEEHHYLRDHRPG